MACILHEYKGIVCINKNKYLKYYVVRMVKIMNKLVLFFSFLVALGFISTSNATIISGDLTTAGGKAVDLSGLEWLSFDHAGLSTLGVSRQDISDSGSIWSQGGWRYASYDEMTALNSSLGLITANDINNEDGISFILDLWDSYTQPENTAYITWTDPSYSLHKTAFDRLYGAIGYYDASGDLTGFGWAQFISSFVDTKTYQEPNTDLNSQITKYSSYFMWELLDIDPSNPNFEDLGSYLVRDSQSVPEPSIILLFGIGLFGLGYKRKVKTKM